MKSITGYSARLKTDVGDIVVTAESQGQLQSFLLGRHFLDEVFKKDLKPSVTISPKSYRRLKEDHGAMNRRRAALFERRRRREENPHRRVIAVGEEGRMR